jgi:hypothetical protein
MAVTQLLATTSAEEHWRAVAGPWLRGQASTAWKEVRPTVVLTPGRAEGFHLRSRLVEEGKPLLGVRFWTPSDARQFLVAHYRIKVQSATQSSLRLLTRTCAERLVRRDGAENASLRSVIREPAAFLRAYDLLLGAGWNPAKDGADYGRELARELQREMDKSGIATQAGLHQQLFAEASRTPRPAIANLLVSGFNAAHWPLWDLLKALVLSSEQAVIALSQPRFFGETIDQLWINSWEDFTYQETSIPDSPAESPAQLAQLAASYETGAREPLPGLDLTFCVTPDLSTQTRAVILHTLDFLQRDECTRLGLVFPEANALALGVADELRRLGIPMNDGPGVLTPGFFECRAWPAWLALQEEPGVPRLIAWLRACEAEDRSTGAEPSLAAETIASVLEGALGETLVDDLGFLARHLEGNHDKHNASAVADFLNHRIALPREETFARFLELTRESFALRGWELLLASLQAEPQEWLRKSKAMLSRRMFLDWLRESNDSQTRARGKESNHFYGRVHLLVHGQLGGQTWSHLILTGMNEGVWPRVFEAGAFGSRHELAALNQQARALNRRVRGEGAQGAGQEIVSAGFGHCLLPLERLDLALRDLCAALESTSHAVCLAAVTTDAGRGLLPSDFFNHSYHVATGHTLGEESFRRLANATAAWCREHSTLFKTSGETANRADRGHAHRPCGAARCHAAVRRLRVRLRHSAREPRPTLVQAMGKRVGPSGNRVAGVGHRRFAVAGGNSQLAARHRHVGARLAERRRFAKAMNPVRRTLVSLVQAAAERTHRRVRERAAASGLDLYPWWEQVWAHARSIAVGLRRISSPSCPGGDSRRSIASNEASRRRCRVRRWPTSSSRAASTCCSSHRVRGASIPPPKVSRARRAGWSISRRVRPRR